jgi:hypothetical protein
MRGNRPFVVVLMVAIVVVIACGCTTPSGGGELLWTEQFGTSEADGASAVAISDDGRIAVAGFSSGNLGATNEGGDDVFVRLLDGDRAIVWTRQLGTPEDERPQGVAFHPDGGLAIAGLTRGNLGGTSEGGYDAFVVRIDDAGGTVWARQFGSPETDVIDGLAVGSDGRVLVAGTTRGVLQGMGYGLSDAFVRAYHGNGDPAWTHQFGSVGEDYALDVAAGPGGRIALAGGTRGDLANPLAPARTDGDAFLRVFEADGTVAWTRQFGTDHDDHVYRVAFADDGTLLAFGATDGALAGAGAGGRDLFMRAYDADGHVLWTRQLGGSGDDYAVALAVASRGQSVVAGVTASALTGASAGGLDAFVARIGAGGATVWLRQFGTTADDGARAIVIGSAGEAIVFGTTGGALEGASSGGDDVFLRAYGP